MAKRPITRILRGRRNLGQDDLHRLEYHATVALVQSKSVGDEHESTLQTRLLMPLPVQQTFNGRQAARCQNSTRPSVEVAICGVALYRRDQCGFGCQPKEQTWP